MFFTLDNMQVDFASASGGRSFLYQPNPRLAPLSHEGLARPYRLKPGHILDVEVSVPQLFTPGALRAPSVGSQLKLLALSQGEGLNLGISKEEVRVHIGDGECLVKTLTLTHLYCEPPPRAPQPTNSSSALPQFVVSVHPRRAGCRLQARAQEPCPTPPGADGQRALGPGPCPV